MHTSGQEMQMLIDAAIPRLPEGWSGYLIHADLRKTPRLPQHEAQGSTVTL